MLFGERHAGGSTAKTGGLSKAHFYKHNDLTVFHDQVLYLKHNLNAQAIAALQGELVNLEENIDRLVREMEASIREADQFISKLQKV